MRVLLLGGSGLLGQNVLCRLIEAGHQVTLLLREGAVDWAGGQKYTVIRGSLLDDRVLSRAAKGCQAIINCAGTTDMSLLHEDDYRLVNRDLCDRLVILMEQEGIAIAVHVSTANTIGYGDRTHPATEEYPMMAPFSDSYYAKTKREGEHYFQNAARKHPDWHVVILNPGFIVGAFDVKPSSGRLLNAAYRRAWMPIPPGGKSFVAAADVAAAAVNALTLGQSGHRYLTTGENLSLRQFYALQAQTCGYKQRHLVLPRPLLLFVGVLGDLLRCLRIRTQVSTCNIRQLMVNEFYCSEKAQRELQMPSTSVARAISDYFEWREKRYDLFDARQPKGKSQ